MINIKPHQPAIAFGSPEWGKVREWLQEELLDTYKRLSNPDTDEKETQRLRGRASLINQMLSFGTLTAGNGPL